MCDYRSLLTVIFFFNFLVLHILDRGTKCSVSERNCSIYSSDCSLLCSLLILVTELFFILLQFRLASFSIPVELAMAVP